MSEKEFFDMMLEERIAMLLEKRQAEKTEETEKAEQILEELEADKKQTLEDFFNGLMEQMAETGRTAYLGGLRDGFRLAEWMRKGDSGLEEMPGIEKALE